MKIQYCSLTGADDAVDPRDLVALSAEYPFAEWALLLLPAQEGTSRVPSLAWIDRFKSVCGNLNTAIHLCDDGFLRFVAGDPAIADVMKGFRRIQLNLKFGAVEGKYDPAALAARVRENPQHQFILQYTADKKSILPLFRDVANHAVLFDESAGRGVAPDSWPAPLAGHFCGYAGGINPGNVKGHLEAIARAAPGYTTWIDMESGVRTDDRFDLAKVRLVLETASSYALKP